MPIRKPKAQPQKEEPKKEESTTFVNERGAVEFKTKVNFPLK